MVTGRITGQLEKGRLDFIRGFTWMLLYKLSLYQVFFRGELCATVISFRFLLGYRCNIPLLLGQYF